MGLQHVLVGDPSPCLLQLVGDCAQVPSTILMDSSQDVQHLLLLPRVGEHGASHSQAPNGDGSDTAVTAVSNNATDLVRMVKLQDAHLFGNLGRFHGVCLGQNALRCVVEKPANGGCTLNQPAQMLACFPFPKVNND